MLADRGIVSAADAHALREALDAISQDDIRQSKFDGSCEDLFFYVERLIVAACGDDAAGRLHVARSRNDIDMTMYRMRQRELVLALAGAASSCGGRYSTSPIAIVTRSSPPIRTRSALSRRRWRITCWRWSSSSRDALRLKAAYERTNCCPLGSCAITGTGFPIDRQLTSDLLGFIAPTGNTYGSIATVDYLLESASATAVLLTGLGRFVQDLLLWGTAEFDYVRFGDGFVQSSSIMPQKRNPVAIEHARAIGSKALGQTLAVLTMRSQHTVRRHRRHRRRPAAAGVLDVPRRHSRGDARGRRRWRPPEFDGPAAESAGGRGLDDADGAGGHAGSR